MTAKTIADHLTAAHDAVAALAADFKADGPELSRLAGISGELALVGQLALNEAGEATDEDKDGLSGAAIALQEQSSELAAKAAA